MTAPQTKHTISIRIPTPLRPYTDGATTVTVEAATAGEALSALADQHPGLRDQLYDGDGTLRSFVTVFRGDKNIRHLEQEQTPLREGDDLSIVPAVAGGSAAQAPPAALSSEERQRYSRHLILPDVGPEGQQRLKEASVLLVGAGGLGSPLAMYLAAAGVGRLGLVDFDAVEASNLQRQLLHDTDDVGRSKLDSARERIQALNPNVSVDLHETRLTSDNAREIVANYDVVADGTDNFPTRYLVNDACVMTGVPNVYASIFRFEGQASVFGTPDGPCYRCAYPEPPPPGLVPSCAEGGVLGVLPGLAGTVQATEVIKVLLGIGEPLVGRLLLIDALEMDFRTMQLEKDPDCPVCSEHPTQTELIDYEQFCGITPSNGQESASEETIPEISVQAFKEQRDADQAPFLLDVRKPAEYEIANLGGTLIPVDELEERLDELADRRDDEIVVHCKSGGRSSRAVKLLHEHGFQHAKNLRGGILAWSEEIDPDMPQY